MIIGTSPNGVFSVNTETEEVVWLLRGNFFGITQTKDNIYLAERELHGTKIHCFTMYLNDMLINNSFLTTIIDVKDVHQITTYKESLVLTDTMRNKCGIFTLSNNYFNGYYTLDGLTVDIDENHINAILCDTYDYSLLVGLNNKGYKESEVYLYNPYTQAEYVRLNNVYHSHDLEPYDDDILISASHQGFVYSFLREAPLFYTGDVWTRGICISEDGIWVGFSAVSPKSSRQDPNLKNSINLFEHETFKHIKSIEILGAGQINDLLYVEEF